MPNERVDRRLAAIVSADVAGYTRLMGTDETGTLDALRAHRAALIDPAIAEHGGRIVKTMGDGLLVEFPSVVEAVQCAIEVQLGMVARNRDEPEDRRIAFRVGVNIGDIIIDGEDILGDGVNLAARLQELSEPGGVCISSRVYDDIRDRLETSFEDGGPRQVKNVARPVHVWRWQPTAGVARAATPSGRRPPSVPDKPSIAVLPFQNMSGDPAQEIFADGLVEDIITTLSKISDLFVIARNSSFAYKGTSPDIRQVARDLGVRNVLEGSVRAAGTRMRITAQLIDAVTGSHLWAERYDRELTDIFELQDEITNEVVTTLHVRLAEGEQVRVRRRQTQDVAAWECYVRGQTHMRRFNRLDNDQARELFQRALDLDPRFGTAWCHLGWVLYNDARFGWCESPSETMEQAATTVEHGLSLDGDQPDAYPTLGMIRLLQRRYDDAEAACARALELGHNSGDCCGLVAMILNYLGDPAKASSLIERAMRLSPFFPDWYLGIAAVSHRLLGDVDEAVRLDLERLKRNPDNNFSDFRLAAIYQEMGRHEEAKARMRAALRKNPEWSERQIRISEPYRDEAELERYVGLLRAAGLPE
jgi:adenylate cyclase